VFGGATTTSPDNGNGMLASRANTEPDVVPITVPGAADVFTVYAEGTKI